MKVGDSVLSVAHHWLHNIDKKNYIGREGQIVSINGGTYYVSFLEIKDNIGYFVDVPFEENALEKITFKIEPFQRRKIDSLMKTVEYRTGMTLADAVLNDLYHDDDYKQWAFRNVENIKRYVSRRSYEG